MRLKVELKMGIFATYFIFIITLALVSWPTLSQAEQERKTIFGLFWRGCEESCEGFKAGIVESGLNAELIVRNVNRDKSKLPDFVKEIKLIKPDLILTFGTSVTLGVAGRISDHGKSRYISDIPIVFMIVADPIGSDIIEKFEETGRPNVTGTYNRVPETVNIQALRKFDPEFKKLGVLYNSNEPNSVLKVDELTALQSTLNFKLTALDLYSGVQDSLDPNLIPIRIKALKEASVDFVYVGSSSFLRRNHAIFTEAAIKNGLPVLSPYEGMVRNSDALLSVAARYRDVGKLAAKQALKILVEGNNPGDLPIARISDFAYIVNMRVARRLKRFPPLEFLQFAEIIK